MKCKYCGTSLPEKGLEGIVWARVKGGSRSEVPVCRQCLGIKANKLEPTGYRPAKKERPS